jgi:hypothetical protein
MAKATAKERAVVVCTAKRGVFFGYTPQSNEEMIGRTATLARARMCTYWSAETHGVMGLAGRGPQRGSKIGPRIPELCCNEVTAVMVCDPKAVEAWEAETWS